MELEFLQWVSETFHSQIWLNYIMKYVTYLGEVGASAIIACIVLLIFKKTRPAGLALGIALVLDVLLINIILKNAVGRPRPWEKYGDFVNFYESINLHAPNDASFPSGHTGACFCAAVLLTMYYKVKGIPAIVVATLVGISRIYLCMHYPTDVLAGALIGSACAVAGYYIYNKGVVKLWAKIKSRRAAKAGVERNEENCVEISKDNSENESINNGENADTE